MDKLGNFASRKKQPGPHVLNEPKSLQWRGSSFGKGAMEPVLNHGMSDKKALKLDIMPWEPS
jgi:hypothetical protein